MKRIVSVILALTLTAFLFAPLPAWGLDAAGAVVMEAETGELLFSQNPRQRLPMASTTKIMTALLTLEQPGLDEPFVVDDAAILVEGSSMGLTVGDTATLRALAGGMLTASGNDAANAAAVRIAGSVPAFADQMNARAATLGMLDTHFVTPSGLDSKEHYSTAYDMALLAREALKNPLFLEMCSAKKLTLFFGSPPYDRTLYNHNRLLNLYPPAIGIKTGFTRESGRCLVSAARKEEITLIAVTLRCGDDWNTHRSLYEQYFPAVERQELAPLAGITLPVAGGAEGSVEAVGEHALSFSQVQGRPREVRQEIFSPQFLYAPIKKGDILGKIVYYIDNECWQEVPLVAAGDCRAAPPESRSWRQALRERFDDWLFEADGP